MINRIIKFGSSTLTSEQGRRNISTIVESHLDKGEHLCVVISLQDPKGVSEETIQDLLKSIPTAEYCKPELLIEVNQKLGNEAVNRPVSFEKITSYFSGTKSNCVITTGFLGEDESNNLSVRPGSSDYTATIIAAAMGAQQVDLYTVVDGVMTANPSKVPSAFSIPHLSYEEATELCHFGARIIYPLAIQPAFEHKIPIRIKNCLDPSFEGTLISEEVCPNKFTVTGVTSIPQVSLMRLEGSGMYGVAGIAKRFFAALSEEKISVILISQASSESSICAAIPPEKAQIAEQVVNREFSAEIEAHRIKPVSIDPDMVVVSVVGANMRHIPGISGRLFQTLGKNGINVSAIAQGSSELNISAVVKKSYESKALNAIHDTFFLSGVTTVHLFQVGVGQVGAKLLSQIEQHSEQLTERGFALKVVGLANSKKMTIDADGLNLSSWQDELDNGETSSPELFVAKAQELNLTNTVFVDCTANDSVANTYASLLESAISIVTPNKRANSSSYEQYLNLKSLARKANVKFFYETNVGAGLPIIGTLNDLMLSGDRVLKIEAVLSGTLSYIFNSFVPGTSFSKVVKVAKDQGYTEPDPRDDLSGTDVARKLLILSRDMGIPLELEDIKVESLVPEDCQNCTSGDDFLAKLPESDAYFDKKLSAAADAGKVLRYIGIIENGQARVALEAVDENHPFYSLSGSDNIISFVTERYLERPLVVKGPGAGTDVTAAGVLADIVRAASYLAF